jgi:hypothetical protein
LFAKRIALFLSDSTLFSNKTRWFSEEGACSAAPAVVPLYVNLFRSNDGLFLCDGR